MYLNNDSKARALELQCCMVCLATYDLTQPMPRQLKGDQVRSYMGPSSRSRHHGCQASSVDIIQWCGEHIVKTGEEIVCSSKWAAILQAAQNSKLRYQGGDFGTILRACKTILALRYVLEAEKLFWKGCCERYEHLLLSQLRITENLSQPSKTINCLAQPQHFLKDTLACIKGLHLFCMTNGTRKFAGPIWPVKNYLVDLMGQIKIL